MRNPQATQRRTEANEKRTIERMEEYRGLCALLKTWEDMPDEMQIAEHDYLLGLRKWFRNVRKYILHRADVRAEL